MGKHNGSNSAADRFNRVHEFVVQFYREDAPWAGVYKNTAAIKTNDAVARQVRGKRRPKHWGELGEQTYVSEDGGPRFMRSVRAVRSAHGYAVHPTQKPEELMRPYVEYSCPPGGAIVVPFVGSGTDMVVARLTGRRAIGVEVDEAYCQQTALRLMQTLPLGAQQEA